MGEKLRELRRQFEKENNRNPIYKIPCSTEYGYVHDYTTWLEDKFNAPKHETVGFTLEDIISVKTALNKIGVSVPETNDLSNIQVINLFRLLALQASKRIYE